jgi:hypothetical protein
LYWDPRPAQRAANLIDMSDLQKDNAPTGGVKVSKPIDWFRFVCVLLVFVFATVITLVVCFFRLTERETDLVVQTIFPLPYLGQLIGRGLFLFWLYVGVQLGIYSLTLSITKVRFLLAAAGLIILHVLTVFLRDAVIYLMEKI